MIHWSRLIYQWSYIKQDLRYTVLNQCFNFPTKRRTYDTLVFTSVLIDLHKVGFTIHWSRLTYRQSYKKQDSRYAGLDHCIDSPTSSRTYHTLVSTNVSIVLNNIKLEECIDSPIIEQDQRFVGLKNAKIVQQDFRHDTQDY